MPKSKKRKKKSTTTTTTKTRDIKWGGGPTKKTRLFDRFILPAVVAAVVIGGGLFLWQTLTASRGFSKLADGGAAILDQVQTLPNDGRRHLNAGERQVYPSRNPTSGPHQSIWTRPGFHETTQPPTQVVHALEHGNAVIYYDRLEPEAEAMLRDWAGLFGGQWDGLVVSKSTGLGDGLVLTAWRKRLDLESFDAESIAAFVDAFRGRGPENQVR